MAILFRVIGFFGSAIWIIYHLITEKTCPSGYWFDSDKYWADVSRGASFSTCERRKRQGKYWTSSEEIKNRNKPKEVIPMVVDIERYEKDKRILGEVFTEMNRKYGEYMKIKNY